MAGNLAKAFCKRGIADGAQAIGEDRLSIDTSGEKAAHRDLRHVMQAETHCIMATSRLATGSAPEIRPSRDSVSALLPFRLR